MFGCAVAVADGHTQPLQGPEGVAEHVGVDGLMRLDGHRTLAFEREVACLAHDGLALPRLGDIHGLDVDRSRAKLIGQLHTHAVATQ